MKESNFQTLFGKWLKVNPPKQTEVYELKFVNTERSRALPFNNVPDHQIKGLLAAEDSGLYHKITDFPMFAGSRVRFNRPKPFDCASFNKAPAFVVVWFYKPRQPKLFYKIPIKRFLDLRDKADRKSMTEEMASKVASQTIHYDIRN